VNIFKVPISRFIWKPQTEKKTWGDLAAPVPEIMDTPLVQQDDFISLPLIFKGTKAG
jgi:hypothetical protein